MSSFEHMPTEREGPEGGIHFLNEPLLSEFEAQETFNERRLKLASEIRKLIATSPLFEGKAGTAEFAHKGVSSLVSIIETPDEKYVLKVPLSLTDGNGEALFLQSWEESGVRVPHVFESGRLGEHPYLIMEYVDAPLLQDAIKSKEVSKDAAWEEMGRTMAQMHTVSAEGCGRIVDEQPEFERFESWLFGENIEKRVNAIRDLGLLDDRHGKLEKMFASLLMHGEQQPHSTLCHFDLTPNNILATAPITVFDPSPMLNYGIIDVGRTVLAALMHNDGRSGENFLKGYYNSMPYDSSAVHASILLNAYWKFGYQYKVGRIEAIKNAQRYLEDNIGLL